MDFKRFFTLYHEHAATNQLKALDEYLHEIYKKDYEYRVAEDRFPYTFRKFLKHVAIPKLREFFEKRGFRIIGSGRNRIGMINDKRDIVIKIPKNLDGIDDNYYEYKNQNKKISGIEGERRTRTKIIEMMKTGIAIAIAEKVIHTPVADQPEWAGCYDCHQVGKNKKGVIKAYDYGIH